MGPGPGVPGGSSNTATLAPAGLVSEGCLVSLLHIQCYKDTLLYSQCTSMSMSTLAPSPMMLEAMQEYWPASWRLTVSSRSCCPRPISCHTTVSIHCVQSVPDLEPGHAPRLGVEVLVPADGGGGVAVHHAVQHQRVPPLDQRGGGGRGGRDRHVRDNWTGDISVGVGWFKFSVSTYSKRLRLLTAACLSQDCWRQCRCRCQCPGGWRGSG